MLRNTGIALLKRLLDVVDAQTPEMADSFLRVSLENYSSETIAARERDLFELSPLALAASSCGGGSGGSGSDGDASGSASGAGADPRPVVGVILMQQDQFFRMNEQGMQEAAASLGADLKVQNAGGALDKEASLIDTYLAQKVDAVLVSPLGSQASIPALRRAHQRGVKVVTYNNGIAADFPVANIQSDQESLGASSGQAARAYIEARLGGKAKVALIGFASQLPEQGGARQRGFKKALEGMPGVTIVAEQDAWNAPEAATTVAALLTKHPDVVWAANEGGTVGAVTACRIPSPARRRSTS